MEGLQALLFRQLSRRLEVLADPGHPLSGRCVKLDTNRRPGAWLSHVTRTASSMIRGALRGLPMDGDRIGYQGGSSMSTGHWGGVARYGLPGLVAGLVLAWWVGGQGPTARAQGTVPGTGSSGTIAFTTAVN